MSDANLLLHDCFGDDLSAGAVLGTEPAHGPPRAGIDAERSLAVDNGALRIAHLKRPGWGRAGIAYGPLRHRPGLALSALVLNGHNASTADEIARARRREAHSRVRRVLNRRPQPALDGNLAVGWFDEPGTGAPAARRAAFVVRGVEGENGQLCAQLDGVLAPLVTGLRNVPVHYVVVLRDRGATFYAAALAGSPGLPSHPHLRPLAITATGAGPTVYAGVHQSVLGQAGFSADTRVQEIRAAVVEELGAWWTTAHAADALGVRSRLRDGAVGGRWTSAGDEALLHPGAPSGLLHLELEGAGGLVWRARAPGAGWRLHAGPQGCMLSVCADGAQHPVAVDREARVRPGATARLQVLDDGELMTMHLDGRLLFGAPLRDDRFAGVTGAGIVRAPGGELARFEAHPREVAVPAALDVGASWDPRPGEEAAGDDFVGSHGEIAGRRLARGAGRWTRAEGAGAIRAAGSRAQVAATRDRPNPGRTLYTVAWEDPGYADLELEQTPPGAHRGQGEAGRCGLVVWDGPDDYLVVNAWLDDAYEATAISAFLTLGGHETHFRSVWCNVGRAVAWGSRSCLRLACDGARWTAWVDQQPVLQRALTDLHPHAAPLTIRAVGLAVNREYGDDTGTVIHAFRARGRA